MFIGSGCGVLLWECGRYIFICAYLPSEKRLAVVSAPRSHMPRLTSRGALVSRGYDRRRLHHGAFLGVMTTLSSRVATSRLNLFIGGRVFGIGDGGI